MSANKKKKFKILGFTLIELLGIVVLLAIISIIATPIILNVIEESRTSANMSSAILIMNNGHNYYEASILDEEKQEDIENEKDIYDKLNINNKPAQGQLYVNNKNEVAMAIVIDNKCYKKTYESEIEVTEVVDCDLGYMGPDEIKPTITQEVINTNINENGWYKEDMYVQINVVDNESGPLGYKRCMSQNECEPEETIYDLDTSIYINTESSTNYVCVIGIDNKGNESEKNCVVYKLDKTQPSIEGIIGRTINVNQVIDLSEGVTYNDALSGIDGELVIEPSSIDASTIGLKQVKYSVKDKAGNTREEIRIITVADIAPDIVYNLVDSSSVNSNGWAKNNFYVRATITDNSGTGIKSAKSCVINGSGECTPIAEIEGTTKDFYISVEGNNRLCIEVTDNNDQVTTLCSDVYKLDKTAPIAGTANITGTAGSNGWYTSNVTISAVNGSDALSGHGSTTTNVSSITSNTTGQVVTITTTDLAGNSASRSYTIKIDKNTPTIPAITGGSTTWSSAAKTISVSTASTSTSGIAYYQYYISTSGTTQTGGSWTNLGSGVTSVSISTNGTRYIYFRAVNNAGKVSGISAAQTTKIDTGTPTKPTITGGSTAWSTSRTISVSTASTSTSGIKNYQYYISTSSTTQTGGSWINLGSGVTSVSISTNGTRYIYFRAVNNAGKAGTVSAAQTTKIDTTQPALKAKATSNTMAKGTSAAPMNYFTITTNYNSSLSGGTTTCKVGSTTVTNLNTLAAGTYTLTCTMKTGTGKTASASTTINLRSFSTDSWAVISSTVKGGYASVYKVGDTKEVAVSGYGTFTVRLANNTTPSECNATTFSQTACGFVVEFVDIITVYQLNSTDTNIGSWPATKARTFINGTIYNALPADLKNLIINTRVVSGHGTSDSANFTSTDKLYLLAVKEVGDAHTDLDTSSSLTRVLDYYNGSENENDMRVKTYQGTEKMWWLRSAHYDNNKYFNAIMAPGRAHTGGVGPTGSNGTLYGIAPAFRIG